MKYSTKQIIQKKRFLTVYEITPTPNPSKSLPIYKKEESCSISPSNIKLTNNIKNIIVLKESESMVLRVKLLLDKTMVFMLTIEKHLLFWYINKDIKQ